MAILSLRESLVLSVCLFLVYIVCLAVRRLFFSPLAKFPGPKLAAATLWYEYCYDVVKRDRYTWKIAEIHARYGMITPVHMVQLIDSWLEAPLFASALMSCISMIPSTLSIVDTGDVVLTFSDTMTRFTLDLKPEGL
ncbi:MAG: hypothetical protein Q9186_002863 [Xanthomendoza sp. 1 TL-2023]